MEVQVKPEAVNGTPLPQRVQKKENFPQKNESELADKKPPRFSMQGGGGGGGGQQNEHFQPPNQNPQQHQQNQGGNFQHNRGGMNNRRGGGRRGGGFGGGGNKHNPNQSQMEQGEGAGGAGNQQQERRGGGGDRRGGGGGGGRGDDFFIARRLENMGGPTHDLPPIDSEESKFSGRNRLYVGNLTNDVTEDELRELFKPFGEISEIFSNAEKNFAFLKVDYHVNAEKAKRELDGIQRKGRNLRVRFAPNSTILRVRNLTPFVSNELLYKAFEIFGPVERAVIIVDDRGKSTNEGIVEFVKKSSSMAAMRLCNEKCFFLTSSLRPCVVEPFELNDDTDGLPDKSLNKKSQDFHQERSTGPRFADAGSFEHEYGSKWKQLHELYKSKQEALKRELKLEEEKLEAQMDFARYEHETEILRQELHKREADNQRKKMEWEMREKQAEEQRKRDEEQMRRQQDEMQQRMSRQNDEMRRRQQENTLFMQAQQLNSLLDQHEINQGGNSNNFDNPRNNFGGGGGPGGPNKGNNPQQDQQFNNFNEFAGGMGGGGGNNQFGGGGGNQNQQNPNQRGGPNNNNGGNNKPWERRDDFQNKRRRF